MKALFFIVFISLLLSFVSRLRFFENELYVKIFSEEICFDFQKHSAHKDILKEFKKLKKNAHVEIRYIDEASDSLLYSDASNIFGLIEIRNGIIENNLYRPSFYFENDGTYVHFTFEDSFLNHVDGILMRLDSNLEENVFYYIPVNTRIDKYDCIIKINEQNASNYNFSIEYTHWNGNHWLVPLQKQK